MRDINPDERLEIIAEGIADVRIDNDYVFNRKIVVLTPDNRVWVAAELWSTVKPTMYNERWRYTPCMPVNSPDWREIYDQEKFNEAGKARRS